MQPEVKEEPKVTETAPVEQAQPETSETPPKNSKDWERFREARAAERKQAEEIAKAKEKAEAEAAALRAALDSALNKTPSQNSMSYGGYNEQEETEEQRIEKKVSELLEKKEKEAARLRAEQEKHQLPRVLQQNHPDFNEVCSADNIDYLEFHHPEIAAAFKYMPDGYDKWSNVYKAIKKFVPSPNSNENIRKAEKNLQKPQSIASPNINAPGQSLPVVLDEARKRANWERMQRELKGMG